MPLKWNVNEIVQQRLPAKGNRRNPAIDHMGLHKRTHMEQIVDYFENGQERIEFPDREAKFIRNRPFMTQLCFWGTQEETESLGRSRAKTRSKRSS